jgi:hypothetical protein
MRRSKVTIQWTSVLCSHCGRTFDYENGVRSPEPGITGARRVLCSQQCAKAWYEENRIVDAEELKLL